MNSEKPERAYPYFGLREGGHREVRHDPLERGEVGRTTLSLGKWLTKLLNPPFNPKKRSG